MLSRGCYFRSRLENKQELRVKLWGRISKPCGTAVGLTSTARLSRASVTSDSGFVEVWARDTAASRGQTQTQTELNSEGHATVRMRLELLELEASLGSGVSLDKNETSDSKEADYCEGQQFLPTRRIIL